MGNEQLLEQVEKLLDRCNDLRERRLCRSGLKVAMEAKRFAKSNRLLRPYLHACWQMMDCALYCCETEIGIDHAMEIIALTESDEKAKKFQHDFGTDQDQYSAAHHCISGYSYLAILTAMRNGYNSPLVHGALDDGIHVCRRNGMGGDLDHFWVFAVNTSTDAGDYDMGEHYARLITSTHDGYSFCGYDLLGEVYVLQGKLSAAFDVLKTGAPTAKTFHNLLEAKIRLAHQVEELCLLSSREAELPNLLQEFGYPDGMPEIPSREENVYHHCHQTINDALRQTIHGNFAEAESILLDHERFLLAHDNLCNWFSIRIQRIASRLLAAESGDNSFTDTDQLADELRRRASKACQWSSIRSLDAMLHRTVRLNPLGIAFPIDIGPYATEGTPISHAQIKLAMPLLEQVIPEPKKPEEEKEKSPLELEIASWYVPLKPLWAEEEQHDEEQTEAPFPKADELAAAEQEVFDKILQFTPDTLTEEEFLAAANLLSRLRLFGELAKIVESWTWMKRMILHFPDRGRPLGGLAYHGLLHRLSAAAADIEPASLGLPEPEELEKWISDAFEKEPNRVGIATIAGMIFRAHGNNREAQRYFSRANQIDRLDTYVTTSLAELYAEAERPRDALATIELYIRAGGRNPGVLWQATQIAFDNEMPQEFLSYHAALMELQPPTLMLDGQRVWALCRTKQWHEALQGLDRFEEKLGSPSRDRLFVRALCLAELGDNAWSVMVDQALNHTKGIAEGIIGVLFDPSEMLWNHLRTDTGERREKFEQFLFERGVVPDDFFSPDKPLGDDVPTRNLYRCYQKQPLSSEISAYAGWIQIPAEDAAYTATWFVFADTPEEATALALESQSRCYPLPAEPTECVFLDSYPAERSQVIAQGKRLKPPSEDSSS